MQWLPKTLRQTTKVSLSCWVLSKDPEMQGWRYQLVTVCHQTAHQNKASHRHAMALTCASSASRTPWIAHAHGQSKDSGNGSEQTWPLYERLPCLSRPFPKGLCLHCQ